MEKFWIVYENKDSSVNNEIFLVREDNNYPHHYLISDGKSHIGGGTLLKKYCKLLNQDNIFKSLVDILITKKSIIQKHQEMSDEIDKIIFDFDNTKNNFYKECDNTDIIEAIKNNKDFLTSACIEVSNFYNNKYRYCVIKEIASIFNEKSLHILNILDTIEKITNDI
jgi:hypothetical protein